MAHEASSIIMKRKSQLMIPEEMTSGCPMANLNDISQQLIVYLKGIQQKKGKPNKRVFHTKTIALVKGAMEVDKDLPADRRVGLFKE